MTKEAWFKFYPVDWRADPGLRVCSLAARGVWIDILCALHDSDEYGVARFCDDLPSEHVREHRMYRDSGANVVYLTVRKC